MKSIPKIIRKTGFVKRLRDYMETDFNEVKHTTLNPEGPGAIRIHLIPPKEEEDAFNMSVALINGTDIIPINAVWSVYLAEWIKQVNKYDGKEIYEADIDDILTLAAASARKIFPFFSKKSIRKDLRLMYETFRQIAYREPVTADIKHLNLGEYADYMKAPHRMDVMVSAMTKDGKWHCNQKCVHCYAAGQEHSDEAELSTEEWKKVLHKLREVGIPQVTFTGGEPTMREDLFELIHEARWFVSRLNTNGIKLDPEYCAKLKEAELDSVQITFYSADKDIHNQLVGATQFEKTAAAIKNALAAGLNISINTPLCTLNRDYVKTLEYLHEQGVIYVTCSGLITTGNATTENSVNLQLTKEEIKEVLKEAVGYCHANGMEIAFTSPGWIEPEFFEELNISSPTCGACLSNMALTPSGNVVPCQSWLSGETLGNMLTDDWDTIWNQPSCQSYRNYSASMTGKCPLRRYC